MEGIMVYNERTAYNEWEFIYDPAKVPPIPPPGGGGIGTPAAQLGQRPGQPGQPGRQPNQPGQQLGQPGQAIGQAIGQAGQAFGQLGQQPAANRAGVGGTGSGPNMPGAAGMQTGAGMQMGVGTGGNSLPPNIRPGKP
jgi:hypothetical protein